VSNQEARTCRDVAASLGVWGPPTPASLEAIERGIRKFVEEHGKPPSQKRGDASPYVGYDVTWAAVNGWLKYHGYGSIPLLCRQMGISTLTAHHDLGRIEEGIRRYCAEHGDRPTEVGGDATLYVGYASSWRGVGEWLRGHGHGSLVSLCRDMGVGSVTASHDLEAIKEGVRAYARQHGVAPPLCYDDASPYLGYQATWDAVSQWLKKEGHGSLPQLVRGMGFDRRPHDLGKIREGVRKYVEAYGRYPTTKSGDATLYVGFQTRWGALDQWLGSNGHGSLSRLCQSMGFAPLRADHDLERIARGVRAYHKEHGQRPSRKSGDATRYVGYSTTWSAVSSWMRHGDGPSLAQLCKRMGLGTSVAAHDVDRIREGILLHYKEHGARPGVEGGDATHYVGYATTWGNVHCWLKRNGHGTLRVFCLEMGL
jgi:hypothetical protein